MWARFQHTIVFITHDIREAVYLSDRIYVMTARPARVRMVIYVELPRPRTIETLTAPRFAELETSLLTALREENAEMREQERAR